MSKSGTLSSDWHQTSLRLQEQSGVFRQMLQSAASASRVQAAIMASRLLRHFEEEASDYFPVPYIVEADIPEGWNNHSFGIDGMHVSCFTSEIENPRAVIRFGLGFNGSPLAYEPFVRKLNEAGYSVALMSPPYPGKRTDFIPTSLETAKFFYTDPRSPANMPGSERVPHYALAHSFSGLVLCDLLNKDKSLKDSIHGVIPVAPFHDTANSSRLFHPEGHRIYLEHASRRTHVIAGQSLADRFYLWLKSAEAEKDPASFSCPEHGQILAMKEFAWQVFEEIRPDPEFPQLYIVSENDNLADPLTASEVARKSGAHIRYISGRHNPMFHTPHEFMLHFTGFIEEMNKRFVPPAPQELPEPASVTLHPGFWERLRHPISSFFGRRISAQAAMVDLPESLEHAR